MRLFTLLFLTAPLLLSSASLAQESTDPLAAFRPTASWTVVKELQSSERDGLVVRVQEGAREPLITRLELADSVISMEYQLPKSAQATVYLQGLYAIELRAGDEKWHKFEAQFRAPRFDNGFTKTQDAFIMDLRIDGHSVASNELRQAPSPGVPSNRERTRGPSVLVARQGSFAVRNFSFEPADFEAIILPTKSGGTTNVSALIDLIVVGREAFESVGCSACHSIRKNDTAVTSGPNLYGLFKSEPRMRDVNEGEDSQRFSVRADGSYLHRSVRAPGEQLAISEAGDTRGAPYPALMPPFPAEVLTDLQIDAIGAYLATLNDLRDRGPAIKLIEQAARQAYDPLEDRFQLLVTDEVRIQRGPMPGVSGRSIHVGQPNRIHYTFDTRILGFAKLWQGGFIDRSGELLDRGGKGFKLGHEAREVALGEQDYLFAPLDERGQLIDFSFKEAKFGDAERARASLYSSQDHLAQLKAIDAKFWGYTRDSRAKHQTPSFRCSVGANNLTVQMNVAESGELRLNVSGQLATSQSFAFNERLLKNAHVSAGEIRDGRWTLPPGKLDASLDARISVVGDSWHPPATPFDYRKQPLRITPASAQLPAGYSIESYAPPKDNYGREQLFEALGLAQAKDGTIFVATRTAGIWRIVKGEWQLFAEGTFDSLGVVIEDAKARSIIVGQKPELTRITDTNGDGVADEYRTLFDAHTYHSNYHEYMHGPVVGGDGAYYININLAHTYDGTLYKAGGEHMGATGGFSGWSIRVLPDGTYSLFANGLRSPAGLGVSPDKRLWYSDNQGEFVGTSKLFVLERERFYGHPASLVDLPGMTPDSPEIEWQNVAATRARAVVLFPHNKVANSPGHPTWDTTKGKFGPFSGQIVIGDQTQSNLLRVSTEVIDGIEQGSVMPFMEGLESGVMRPLFLRDGSLLLGQTGRGWQAKGGHVASLQHVRWDGETIAPAIKRMTTTTQGFRIELTQPLRESIEVEQLKKSLRLQSWVYRDAPEYGSPELDTRDESIATLVLANDRRAIELHLSSLEQPRIHPQQTARVYHAQLDGAALFDNDVRPLDVYYTLYGFPKRR